MYSEKKNVSHAFSVRKYNRKLRVALSLSKNKYYENLESAPKIITTHKRMFFALHSTVELQYIAEFRVHDLETAIWSERDMYEY